MRMRRVWPEPGTARTRVACLAAGIGLLALVSVAAQGPARPASSYDVAYIGEPLADPVMQHAKETFVLFGCAYCHGVTLIPRGEAADLMHVARVGADVDGNILGPLLRAGIPQTAKLSPMPQFSDLSDRQIADLVRYIHYGRQQGRLKELTAEPVATGSAAAGREFYAGQCASCHTSASALARGRGAEDLRRAMLDPPGLQAPASFAVDGLHDRRLTEARQRHHLLLENFTATQVADLLAFLRAN